MYEQLRGHVCAAYRKALNSTCARLPALQIRACGCSADQLCKYSERVITIFEQAPRVCGSWRNAGVWQLLLWTP